MRNEGRCREQESRGHEREGKRERERERAGKRAGGMREGEREREGGKARLDCGRAEWALNRPKQWSTEH